MIATAYRKRKIGASFFSNVMKKGMFDLHHSLLTASCFENIEKLLIIGKRHSTIRVSICL